MKSEKKVDKSQIELKITLDEGEWQECLTIGLRWGSINYP